MRRSQGFVVRALPRSRLSCPDGPKNENFVFDNKTTGCPVIFETEVAASDADDGGNPTHYVSLI